MLSGLHRPLIIVKIQLCLTYVPACLIFVCGPQQPLRSR